MVGKAAVLASSICLVLLSSTSTSEASNAAKRGFDLPQPNGHHAVGTTMVVLGDPHRSRDLLVTIWYPAGDGISAPAPYMDQKTADALAKEWNLQPDFQRLVRTHARILAPIAEGDSFPVVLLEIGRASCRERV